MSCRRLIRVVVVLFSLSAVAIAGCGERGNEEADTSGGTVEEDTTTPPTDTGEDTSTTSPDTGGDAEDSGVDTTVPDASDAGDAGDGGETADATCRGCVTEAGECVAGDEASACGREGEPCQTCGSDEICSDQNRCIAEPGCDPDDCDGCCDGDTCRSGDSASACGSGGNQCVSCGTDETCTSAGNCEKVCDASTCDGCCSDNGICKDGQSQKACGRQGNDCKECTGTEVCAKELSDTGGSCVEVGCNENSCPNGCCDGDTCRGGTKDDQCGTKGKVCIDCGTNVSCQSGQCEPDPNSKWKMLVHSASISPNSSNASSWDSFGGIADLYVKVTLKGVNRSGRTDTVSDRRTASFSSKTVLTSLSPSDFENNDLYIEIYDDDYGVDPTICSLATRAAFIRRFFTGAKISRDMSCGNWDATVTFQLKPN